MDPTIRFEIYGAPHKGLRAFMCEVLVRAGQVEECNLQAAKDLVDLVFQMTRVLRAHMANEDELVHPLLEAAERGCTRVAAADHQDQKEAIAMLEKLAIEVATDPTRGALDRIYGALALIIAGTFVHMDFEEKQLEGLASRIGTGSQFAEMHQRIVSTTAEEDFRTSFAWAVRAASPSGRVQMVARARAAGGNPLLRRVLDIAKSSLAPDDWLRLIVDANCSAQLAN